MQSQFPQSIRPVLWALLTLKIVALFTLAFNTRFVMDEFWHFAQSNYVFNGFFDDIWPGKAIGYAAFFKLSHWIGWDAQSMLLAARLQTAALTCAILWLVYKVCRLLGHDRVLALLMVILLLSVSTFIERSFRLRSEPLAIFLAIAALVVAMQYNLERMRTVLVTGLLCGLAFVTTQKSIYFCFALGLAIVMDAGFAKKIGPLVFRSLWFTAGVVLAIILYGLVFGGLNPLPVWKILFTGPLEVATEGQTYYGNLRTFVYQTLWRNAPIYFVSFLGLVLTAIRIIGLPSPARIHLIFTLIMTILVFRHNQPWPYVFTMVLPVLVPMAARLFLELKSAKISQVLLLMILVFVAGFSFKRNVYYLQHDNLDQLELVGQAEALLPVGGTYFDGIGMVPSRTMSPRLWLDRRGIYRVLNDKDTPSLMSQLRTTPPDLIILSSRTDKLRQVLQPLLNDSYVQVASNISISGQKLLPSKINKFISLVPQKFVLFDLFGNRVPGEIIVNGNLRSTPIMLEVGEHTLEIPSETALIFLPETIAFDGVTMPMEDQKSMFGMIYNF